MSDTNNSTITPIDIAGTYSTAVRRPLDAQFELLRNSESNSDAGREGVRAALHGGRFPFDESKKKGLDQQAIIEFVCDKDRTGLEGDEKDNGEREDTPNDDKEKDGDGDGDGEKEGEGKSFSRRDEGNGKCEDSEASLRFCGYEVEKIKDKQIRTLRLEWRTQYACEDAPADTEGTGWGFFTWFIIMYVVFPTLFSFLFSFLPCLAPALPPTISSVSMEITVAYSAGHSLALPDRIASPRVFVSHKTLIMMLTSYASLFLAIAAYLIFGSWLNYNRYGARGWDLLPHGDTIRDIPYLLKDWARRVVGTIQGPGSRGGYSAV